MSGKGLKAYWMEKGFFLPVILTALVYNIYFIWLLPNVKLQYLVYMDVLVLTGLLFGSWYGFRNFRGRQEQKEAASRETELLREELKAQFDENCELQDFVARWCHEVKIPLSAAILMTEKLEETEAEPECQRGSECQGGPEEAEGEAECQGGPEEAEAEPECQGGSECQGGPEEAEGEPERTGKPEQAQAREVLREQLERIRQLLANALLGCKVQSSLFDLQIGPVSLAECVRTSLHNNQFFLIRKHFEPDIRVGEEKVYTDKEWLVYILDQLVSNAVKYVGDRAVLLIYGDASRLVVEDRGVGIREEELRRVFEKGFTGSNQHNGRYKSTGMGLYMAKKIAEKLGHGLTVESVYGAYTRFTITFADDREHFLQET